MVLYYQSNNLIFTVVLLGLQAADLTVMENETFSVCVEITEGSLERNVSIGLVAENSSSAQGKSCHNTTFTLEGLRTAVVLKVKAVITPHLH